MSDTYQERVGRFRVMRQLNCPLRNPEGNWSLYYSSDDKDDADAVCKDVEENEELGDKFKVVDNGVPSYITRMAF